MCVGKAHQFRPGVGRCLGFGSLAHDTPSMHRTRRAVQVRFFAPQLAICDFRFLISDLAAHCFMAPIHVHLQMGPFQELEAESGNGVTHNSAEVPNRVLVQMGCQFTRLALASTTMLPLTPSSPPAHRTRWFFHLIRTVGVWGGVVEAI